MTCSSLQNETIAVQAETLHFYAQCQQDSRARCEWLIAAADCGHQQAEQDLLEIPNCYLSARKRQLGFQEDEVVTFFPVPDNRAHECGYITKKTTIGYILWPIGVAVALPTLAITGPVVCLAHMKCDGPWKGE